MVETDVVLAKIATIDRCLARVADVNGARRESLLPLDVEDIVVVNLQRAVQAAIDLAAHVVATEGLGLPADLGDTFTLLEKNGYVEPALAARLRKMVGFRNIAVHQYERIDPAVVDAIIRKHLSDLSELSRMVLTRFGIGTARR